METMFKLYDFHLCLEILLWCLSKVLYVKLMILLGLEGQVATLFISGVTRMNQKAGIYVMLCSSVATLLPHFQRDALGF